MELGTGSLLHRAVTQPDVHRARDRGVRNRDRPRGQAHGGEAVKLTEKEQRHVRTAIRFLRFKVGGWQPLADALGMKVDSLVKVVNARGRDVTARLAYSVARLTDVSIDDLLLGALLSPRTCPHCGRAPDSDFVDEETVVEDRPREAVLKLVK